MKQVGWHEVVSNIDQYIGISLDTRTVQDGEVFVALKGERFDAHDYLHTINTQPSLMIVSSAEGISSDYQGAVFVCENPLLALQQLAKEKRAQHDAIVIGVAGSNGKTSLKEMIACICTHVLGESAVLKTQGNLNNHIGVPCTLLSLLLQHKVAIVEMGMNHPNEMKILSDMVRPNIAIVNNAQREHQEFMHTVEAVAKENGTVFEYLSHDGVAIYPNDTSYQSIWLKQAGKHKQYVFSVKQSDVDIYAKNIRFHGDGMSFDWVYQGGVYHLSLPVLGEHHVHNALGAIMVALSLGFSPELIVDGLSRFKPVSGRMQFKLVQDCLWINDTYNANPDSVLSAIDVLSQCPAPRCLVLGDMGEVGKEGQQMHAEVGAYAKEKGIDMLLTVGELSNEATHVFGVGAIHYQDVKDMDMTLLTSMGSVLVKGSRFMKMESVFSRMEEVGHAISLI